MFKRRNKTQKVVVIQGQVIRIEEFDHDVIEALKSVKGFYEQKVALTNGKEIYDYVLYL